jgi:hypothetical protein
MSLAHALRRFVRPLTAASLAGAIAVALHGCAEPNAVAPDIAAANNRAGYAPAEGQRQYGVPITLGAGKVRAYVVTDHRSSTPLEIGVAIDAAAMSSLPTDMQMLHLQLPPKAPAPYTFVMFDWNPSGHPPVGTYTLPHFDFHFYTISEAEVGAIDPATLGYEAKADNLPPQPLWPQSYVALTPPGLQPHDIAVPFMGVHWNSLLSPELPIRPNPAQFTKTFIYGSWNGKFTFLEPMITVAYLQHVANTILTETIPIPQSSNMAAAFQASGWYPGAYRITYDAQHKEYRVAIVGLTERTL